MFPIVQTAQVGRDDGADGTGVSRAIGVAADIAVDGTDVEAGAAADAVKRVALFGVGEELGAAVVEQYHVIVLRAIGFAGLTRPAVKGGVTRHGLSRA